jgi:membrane-bound lytic murein transglycosylase A
MVHQTMATATASANNDSSRNHPIASRLLRPFALRATIAAAIFAAIAGCVTTPPVPPPAKPPVAPPPPSLPARYVPVAWTALPGWNDDRVDEAWPAFRAGCATLVAGDATNDLWQGPCSAAETLAPIDQGAVRRYFEAHFIPYRVEAADGRDTGMVTGYYEPLLDGSRVRSARYNVPLYAAPDDLLTIDLTDLYPELKGKRLRGRVEGRRVVPYWSRAEIENGTAPVADKVLVYVADPVDAFFLQIQGSGRVRLAGGGIMRVGYADQNGYPYVSIGRILVERGELPLERASLQGIREWGRNNPQKLGPLLDENPSYVFFREVPPPAPGTLEAEIDGPYGSLGVPLLRERTIAVDPRSVPLGAPVYLATTYPLSTRPLDRLVLAQDTGGAIRGAVRADFFWGFGNEAGREAGRMKQDGRMWILWPKDAPPPTPR